MASDVTCDMAVFGSMSSRKKSFTIDTPSIDLDSWRAMPLLCPVQRSMRDVMSFSTTSAGMPG